MKEGKGEEEKRRMEDQKSINISFWVKILLTNDTWLLLIDKYSYGFIDTLPGFCINSADLGEMAQDA